MQKHRNIFGLLVILLLLAGSVGFAFWSASLPTVQYSNSTRECVQVIEPDGSQHSCTELTSTRKHYSEWVR